MRWWSSRLPSFSSLVVISFITRPMSSEPPIGDCRSTILSRRWLIRRRWKVTALQREAVKLTSSLLASLIEVWPRFYVDLWICKSCKILRFFGASPAKGWDSLILNLFLAKNRTTKGGGYTPLWTLLDSVLYELPQVQYWGRCRRTSGPPLGLIGANFLRAWCCWTLPSCRTEDFVDLEL